MPANEMIPYAFRTTAYLRTTKLLRRQKRAFTLDVLWPDGRVDRNVRLGKLGHKIAPADYEPTDRGMRRHTPETGTGPWIAYVYGGIVAGPE